MNIILFQIEEQKIYGSSFNHGIKGTKTKWEAQNSNRLFEIATIVIHI